MQGKEGEYTDTPPNNALVPVSPGGPVNRFDPTAGGSPFWSSFDPRTAEGKAKILQAHGDGDLEQKEVLGKVIRITDIVAHGAEVRGPEDGEIVEITRVVLFTDEGATVAFMSAGVVRYVRLICQLYGQPPWHPPLPIMIKPITTGSKRTYYTIRVQSGEDTPVTHVGKKGK